MRSAHQLYASPPGRILMVVLAILFPFFAGSANAASEPGAITIVTMFEPINQDPNDAASGSVGRIMMKNIVEPLTEINLDDSSIMPRLATSWKQIDANTWHFFLRKGVKFHDGADFNAEAVVFNFKRLYDKKIRSMARDKFFSHFKLEGKALDSHTVEVKTDKFEPLLMTLMTTLVMASPNTPMALTRHPIGTGPYKFVKWDAGTQIVMERFDGYWGKQPQVKKATYVWRGESAVRAAMVAIGEADLAAEITIQDANRPDLDSSYPSPETTYIRFGGEWEPPLNDRRVRMALNYAIDRDTIRGSILSKESIPATQMVVSSTYGYNSDLKPWPYDPKKAKQLLDEARKDGIPVDKEITLVGQRAYYPGSEELDETVMSMYRAVGLNVKIKPVERGVFSTYRDKPYPTTAGPYLVHNKHDNSMGDAGFTVRLLFHCKGRFSSSCDKKLDDLIEKAEVATGEERKNLWRAAFHRIHEEIIPGAMLFHLVGYARVGKRINFKPNLVVQNEIQIAQITFKQ